MNARGIKCNAGKVRQAQNESDLQELTSFHCYLSAAMVTLEEHYLQSSAGHPAREHNCICSVTNLRGYPAVRYERFFALPGLAFLCSGLFRPTRISYFYLAFTADGAPVLRIPFPTNKRPPRIY